MKAGDSEFNLRDASGTIVAHNDDTGPSTNSFMEFTPTATGTYFIEVFDHNNVNRGAYSLLVANLNATNVFEGGGADTVTAGQSERIAGAAGNDVINLGMVGFDALGEQGDDQITGNDTANILAGGLGNDFISGGGSDDALFGDSGDDVLQGDDGRDQLFGGDGLDDLHGDAGNDRLSGGAGTDDLLGGSDSDSFVFKSLSDSVVGANRDQILDFSHIEGDHIDVSEIDANNHLHGNQAFKFIGSHHFDRHAGELRVSHHVLQGDVNGDGRADFEVHLNVATLVKGDFVL